MNQMLSSATCVSAANQQPTASNIQLNIRNNLLFNADPRVPIASSSKCSTSANDNRNDYLQQGMLAVMQQSQNGAGGNLAQTLLMNQMLSSATCVSAANQMPNIQSYPASNIQPNISNNLLFNADPMIVSFLHFYPISLFAYSLIETFQDAAKLLERNSRPNSSSKGCTGIYFSSAELCQFLSLIKCIFILIDLIRCFLPASHFSFGSPLFLSAFTLPLLIPLPSTTAFINHLCNHPLKWYLKL